MHFISRYFHPLPFLLGLTAFCLGTRFPANAQTGSDMSYAPPTGLTIRFSDSAYAFSLGGFVQPVLAMVVDSSDRNTYWNARRTFLIVNGASRKERVGFSMQADFSQSSPLMDAFVYWKPVDAWQVSFGQRQSPANNREMLYREDGLAFTDRSVLSRTFARTGREFGMFVQGRLGTRRPIMPSLALTSGDGRNSFGIDSRDNDQGGWKMGGRLDWYPLGLFSGGNGGNCIDLTGEPSLKLVAGVYGNTNQGASDAVGEGHNSYLLYDTAGTIALPDYDRWGVDVVAKFRGLSLLMEYQQSTARLPARVFADAARQVSLRPGQIASFLALGSGWNLQGGYYRKGWGIDVRRQQITPEFALEGSVVQPTKATAVCASRHLKDGSMRVQLSYERIQTGAATTSGVECMWQMRF